MMESIANHQSTSRKAFLDIAKGIAIICMIAGHLGDETINRFVHTFHMPLFFILSGYFFRFKNGFLVKSIWKYILPYLFTAFVILLFWELKSTIKVALGIEEAIVLRDNIKDWLLMTLYASGHRQDFFGFVLPYIGAIWFLPALSWAYLVMYAMSKARMPEWTNLIVVLLLFSFSVMSAYWTWLPFSFQAGLSALLFFYLGHVVMVLEGKIHFSVNLIVFVALVLWVASVIQGQREGSLDIAASYFPSFPINLLGACAGSYLMVAFSWLLERVPRACHFLSFFGRYSLVVLCVHLLERNFVPWGILYHHLPNPIAAHLACLVCKLVIAFIAIIVIRKNTVLSKIYAC